MVSIRKERSKERQPYPTAIKHSPLLTQKPRPHKAHEYMIELMARMPKEKTKPLHSRDSSKHIYFYAILFFVLISNLLIGAVAGLHASCYGAYKDSPYEPFRLRLFVREILIAAGVALALSITRLVPEAPAGVLFLAVLAISRAMFETYKLFIRVEPQQRYKIPSMAHMFRRVITSRRQRIFFGMVFYGLLFITYLSSSFIFNKVPLHVGGLVLGIAIGGLMAIGGAYKDGFFEGFDA